MAPRIDPCGTPEVTGKGLDVAPNIALAGIDCVGTILTMLAGSPQNHTDVASLRVPRGSLCRSKAFDMSRHIISTCPPLSSFVLCAKMSM